MSTYQESQPSLTVSVAACAMSTPPSPSCDKDGHDWQLTMIIGYFKCTLCDTLAACQACVSKVRGRAMVSTCRVHLHLSTSNHEHQEVLG